MRIYSNPNCNWLIVVTETTSTPMPMRSSETPLNAVKRTIKLLQRQGIDCYTRNTKLETLIKELGYTIDPIGTTDDLKAKP